MDFFGFFWGFSFVGAGLAGAPHFRPKENLQCHVTEFIASTITTKGIDTLAIFLYSLPVFDGTAEKSVTRS